MFLQYILCFTLLFYISCIVSSEAYSLSKYPSSNSNNNRVLGMILSYNLGHIDPLVLTINEYVSMCESGKVRFDLLVGKPTGYHDTINVII